MKNQSDKEGKSNRYFQVMKKRYVLIQARSQKFAMGGCYGAEPLALETFVFLEQK